MPTSDDPRDSRQRTDPRIASDPMWSIPVHFADLLAPLSERQPIGLVARLARGHDEGWCPTKDEVACLVERQRRRVHPVYGPRAAIPKRLPADARIWPEDPGDAELTDTLEPRHPSADRTGSVSGTVTRDRVTRTVQLGLNRLLL